MSVASSELCKVATGATAQPINRMTGLAEQRSLLGAELLESSYICLRRTVHATSRHVFRERCSAPAQSEPQSRDRKQPVPHTRNPRREQRCPAAGNEAVHAWHQRAGR